MLNYSGFRGGYMKTLEEQMSFYAAYHQDKRNKASHFFGVPMIIISLFIPLSWVKVMVGDVAFSGSFVFAAAILLYYVFLDAALAVAAAVFTALFIVIADWIVGRGTAVAWSAFAVLFIGGWIIQLVGHHFEGRKPALVDNLFQIFIAPIFLCAELFFALGYKPRLHAAVQERALRLRSAS